MTDREASSVDDKTKYQLLAEIDRLTRNLDLCFRSLARVCPKPLLVDGSDMDIASTYEEGFAQETARRVARRLLKGADCNDLGGCPLCTR